MPHSTVVLIAAFSALMIAVSFGIGVWAKKKANTERISTFLPPEALSKLKDEANEKGINVSALIRMIVLEHLAQKK